MCKSVLTICCLCLSSSECFEACDISFPPTPVTTDACKTIGMHYCACLPKPKIRIMVAVCHSCVIEGKLMSRTWNVMQNKCERILNDYEDLLAENGFENTKLWVTDNGDDIHYDVVMKNGYSITIKQTSVSPPAPWYTLE